MTTEHNIRLTSAEIGSLWLQYITDSMATCIMTFFLNKTEDAQIRPVLEYAISLSRSHLQAIDAIFRQEDFPTPTGFTDKDVSINAPRLFCDPYHLTYVKNSAKSGMIAYGLSLSLSARRDVRDFLLECLKTSADLDEMATQVMLSKGIYVRPPYITVPDRVEYVKNDQFLGSLFGKQRPLSALEISHLFLNAQSNSVAKALLIGFSQVAHSRDLRQLFVKGAQIADKHIEIFGQSLKESGLPAPMSLDSDIMDTLIAPFSDKLMLFHVTLLMGMGLGYYAAAVGASARIDLVADYGRLSAEIEKYVFDCEKVMANNSWMEEPPLADDRNELALSH
ncbi:MAG: DUF3231 family protein [Negativicutes bacterium]|nr:DUF3231 family protein [Negativicutes bacterium]